MKISRFTVNPFGENTYILWDEKSREAAIVDPGMSNGKEIEVIDKFISDNNLKIKHLLLTHLHIDHVFAHSHIEEKYGLIPECSVEELSLGSNLSEQALKFGVDIKIAPIINSIELNEGDIIRIGNEDVIVIKIPGHSPGGLAFYSAESNFILPGDILFEGSIGRTDLEGGDYDMLISGIKEKLFKLSSDVLVCPGHGNTTTIGNEREFNPFLR